MQIPRRLRGLLVAAAVCGSFAACNNEPVEQTIKLTGNDQMKFDQSKVEVRAPARLTIHFENVGTMPKVSMGHNFILLKKGVTALDFASRCVSAGASPDNDFLPESLRGEVIAATKVLGPGEKETVTAELASGVYNYVCTFPGHAAVMRGEIIAR